MRLQRCRRCCCSLRLRRRRQQRRRAGGGQRGVGGCSNACHPSCVSHLPPPSPPPTPSTVCTLADLNYDIYHATIDGCEDGSAAQEFYVRPRSGAAAGFDRDQAELLRAMLESSIQVCVGGLEGTGQEIGAVWMVGGGSRGGGRDGRWWAPTRSKEGRAQSPCAVPPAAHASSACLQRRFPKGLKVHVHSLDRFGCLAALTRVMNQVCVWGALGCVGVSLCCVGGARGCAATGAGRRCNLLYAGILRIHWRAACCWLRLHLSLTPTCTLCLTTHRL